MVLQNPLYTAIDFELKKVNSYIQNGNCFNTEYKSYDKEKDNQILFYIWDLKNQVSSQSGVVIGRFNYEGNLSFSYNKATNELKILSTPTVKFREVDVPYFTNDLVEIINEKLNHLTDIKDVKITFPSQTFLPVIDKNSADSIPSIKSTFNYRLLNEIVENIAREEMKITDQVKAEKLAKDARDKKLERAIYQKTSILGLNPQDFENYEDFEKQLNNRVVEYAKKKIASIDRHLKMNIHEIKECLYKACNGDIGAYDSVYYSSDFYSDEEYSYEEKLEFMECEIDNYINDVMEAIDSARREKDYTESWHGEDHENYKYVVNNATIMENLKREDFKDVDITYNAPLDHRFELVMQIDALQKQRKFYENILHNPQNAVIEFMDKNNPHGFLMQLPCFLRVGRNIERGLNRFVNKTHNLLMIKPGVKEVDIANIRKFTRSDGIEFGKTKYARREFMSKFHENSHDEVGTISICVPSSLRYEEIAKLVNYAINNSRVKHFVCENIDIATIIKSIYLEKAHEIYTAELKKAEKNLQEEIENYKSFYGDDYERWCTSSTIGRKKGGICQEDLFLPFYVNVDPTYYQNFFLKTPDNAEFLKMYRPNRRQGEKREAYKYRGYLIDDVATAFVCLKDKPLEEIKEILLGGYTNQPNYASKEDVKNPNDTVFKEFWKIEESMDAASYPHEFFSLPQMSVFDWHHRRLDIYCSYDNEFNDRVDNNTYGLNHNYRYGNYDEHGYEEDPEWVLEEEEFVAEFNSFNENYCTDEFQNYLYNLEVQQKESVPAIEYFKAKVQSESNYEDIPPIEDVPEEGLTDKDMLEISEYLDNERQKIKNHTNKANDMVERFLKRHSELLIK